MSELNQNDTKVGMGKREKSVVVWNYEILLILTAVFSLWNYGSISLMTMNVDTASSGASDVAISGADDNLANTAVHNPVADGEAFVFTVMATGAALTILAFIRIVFRSHFSNKTLHRPLLLIVFSIPILLLLLFVGGLYAFDLLN